MSWRELETAAPAIAQAARDHVAAHRIALLGTIRPDGSPRISPIEPAFVDDDLVVALFTSPKVEDLRRDPRCVFHTLVPDDSGSEPEVKLTGRAEPTDEPRIRMAEGTWWQRFPGAAVALFILEVDEAVAVTWLTGQNRMRIARWRRGRPVTELERAYP